MYVIKKVTVVLNIDLITENSIIYVLIVWTLMIVLFKILKLERYGFKIKIYSITYKNNKIQSLFTKLLSKNKQIVYIFANVSVFAGFSMMCFAFWFLLHNIFNFFIEPTKFSEMTLLIPGITLTSSSSIAYFLLSVPIVLVIHEGAHGIVSTLEKIKIKTGGFIVFITMFAGFVEPDDDEFTNAKKISKLRVIGAGATSNMIFSFILGIILVTNPFFAIILPEPLLSWFYEKPNGVAIISIMEESGAEKAGMIPGDIIIKIENTDIITPIDFRNVKILPNDVITVTVTRDGEKLEFHIKTIQNADDPESGLIGIIRDNSISYKPLYGFIEWTNREVSMFLLWLWMISFFIGIINMLPLPILDGGKFVQCMIDKNVSKHHNEIIMYVVYSFTSILFVLNIALSYIKSGWFTI